MAITSASDIPSLSLLYKLGKLSPAPAGTKPPTTISFSSTALPAPSKSFNDRIGLIRGDITTLSVDAIVNAANSSLLGGGGADGAIHRAAGRGLVRECRSLGGCPTGSAKITAAYSLPCRKVIHAVGPVYDMLQPEESERLLTGCYEKSLELAVQYGCRTVAFSGLSTGVYGYPSREAAPVAITAVRKFLEGKDGASLDKVVFVTFEKKDVDAYNDFLPLYFPPVTESSKVETQDAAAACSAQGAEAKAEAKAEAEAQEVASELPDVPKTDPDATGPAEKKQKHTD
ncbi:O-acetyl-ADP-ribose deacetylase MACROD1 [Pleurostoma richardsiae]|uniref:O-acetyl-ADP-ribose deacetylase MACROD1 n=1 Tax=Pleurostoma richardsiae TaxID=41990 RepID=A0AA38VNM5_9PEZI|nr:O-acetyl-ADP-ribose deacetylase MACROD1 [Pleurostoma richardsiae]